jgi:hypothetical protein
MEIQDDQELMRVAVQKASRSSELCVVTTFKGYRARGDGANKNVVIEVRDGGPSDPFRYCVVATDEDGRVATGNPFDKLEAALAMVHWQDLDT